MRLDKGNKVTTGSTISTAIAGVIVWVAGLLDVPMDMNAASSLYIIAAAAGGAIADWFSDDD